MNSYRIKIITQFLIPPFFLLLTLFLFSAFKIPLGTEKAKGETKPLPSAVSVDEKTGIPGEKKAEGAAVKPVVGTPEQGENAYMSEDEKEAALRFLKSKEKVEMLLGPTKTFIYDPTTIRFKDPMVIPWSLLAQIVPKKIEEMEKLIKEGRLTEAEPQLNLMFRDFEQTQYGPRIKELIEEIKTTKEKGVTPTPIPTPVFPPSVLDKTSAILWDEKKPVVMVGDDVLSEGDSVPGFDNVIIKKILPSKVIFSYKVNDTEYEKEKLINPLED